MNVSPPSPDILQFFKITLALALDRSLRSRGDDDVDDHPSCSTRMSERRFRSYPLESYEGEREDWPGLDAQKPQKLVGASETAAI